MIPQSWSAKLVSSLVPHESCPSKREGFGLNTRVQTFIFRHFPFRVLCLIVVLAASAMSQSSPTASADGATASFPFSEKLVYRVEWRLITAGTATLELKPGADHRWQTNLNIESAGVLARLYRVLDAYRVTTDAKFCLVNSELDAQESKRHVVTSTALESASNKLHYEEKDLVKNSTTQKELEVPPCTREISGALASLRLAHLEAGKSTTIPITDGKKVVSAKIESQARETLNLDGKKFQTMRYEAFLFDNVLYRRKGRLFVWITEDPERLPVQIRIQLGFPIGNVMIQLDKQQHTPG